jgi:hypothetical protein
MDLLALENRDNYNVSKFRCTPGKGVHIKSKTTRLLDQRPHITGLLWEGDGGVSISLIILPLPQ